MEDSWEKSVFNQFDIFDKKKSGFITADEVKEVFKRVD